VKRFRVIADVGYCASKRAHFYGFKSAYSNVENQGLIMSDTVAPASHHDVVGVEEVIEQSPYPVTLADKGYLANHSKKS
jgi:hypothetical protein